MKRKQFQSNLTIESKKESDEDVKREVPPFIGKTFQILENPSYNKIISWINHGKEFQIIDVVRFEEEVLKRHFKHKSIISFIRQLNLYGFKKVRSKDMTFKHDHFHKDNFGSIHNIKRQSQTNRNQNFSQDQIISAIDRQNEQLKDLNNNIQYVTKIANDLNKKLNESLLENKRLWQKLYLTQEKYDIKLQKFEQLILTLLNPSIYLKQLSQDGNKDITPLQNIIENNYKVVFQNLMDLMSINKNRNEGIEYKQIKHQQDFENQLEKPISFRKNSNTDLMLCDKSFDINQSISPFMAKSVKDDDEISQKSNHFSVKSLFNSISEFS